MGWRLEVLMVVTVVLLLVVMMLVGWSSAAGNNIHTDPDAVHQHDVCEDNGAALLCPPDHVVQVQGARCAGVKGLRPCEPGVLDTLFRLCHGRRTCSGLDLAQVFGTLCHHSTVNGGHLVVGYTCRRYAPTAAPPCVANLCSNVTRGLRCPGGSVLHVRNVTCGQGGEEPCALATFLMLYSLCEGRGDCDARGLRLLRPLSMYCRHQTHPELRHVFVDFVCLPHDVVQSQCLPRAANLTAPFGLLMSPGFPVHEGKPSNRDRQCDWLLASRDPGDVVHVMVHMAYSRWQARNCRASHFLRVDYRDCRTKQRIVREFCDLSDVNIPITSCGDVRVTSWLLGGSGDSSRFLLSYLVVPRGGQVAPPRGTLECQTSLATPPPPTLTHALTTRPTFSRRNYGPGRTMFDYSDTIRHMGTESDMSEQAEDDTFQLKLILLYIFFGVVILALIIALIYVLMSYRGISRRGRHGSDSSEKTALWRHEDTPLHTFSQNSHATLADVANDLYAPSPPPTRHVEHGDMEDGADSPDSQVVACTVHAKSTEEEEEERRLSTGSALSSFLSGRDMDLQDLLDSFPSGHSLAATRPGDYDVIAGTDGGDYDSIDGNLDTGDYDTIASKETDYDSIGDVTADDVSPIDGQHGAKSSTRSNSFVMNGEAGNIYESLEDQQKGHLGQPHGFHTACLPPPALPPPPTTDPTHPSYVEHYTINDDDYAMVRKPRGGGVGGTACKPPTMSSSVQPDLSVPGMVGGGLTSGQPANTDLTLNWGDHI